MHGVRRCRSAKSSCSMSRDALLARWAASAGTPEGAALLSLLGAIGCTACMPSLAHYMQARAEWWA